MNMVSISSWLFVLGEANAFVSTCRHFRSIGGI